MRKPRPSYNPKKARLRLVAEAKRSAFFPYTPTDNIVAFRRHQEVPLTATGQPALHIRIEHPNADVWELSLGQMCLGQPELGVLLGSLYVRNITKIKDVEYRRVASLFEGADVTFKQKRIFLERLKSFALARLTYY